MSSRAEQFRQRAAWADADPTGTNADCVVIASTIIVPVAVTAELNIDFGSTVCDAGFPPQTAKCWPGFRHKPRNQNLCGEVRLKQACGRC